MWTATASCVEWTAEAALPAGWYRFRFRLKSADRFAVRKRAELLFDMGEGFTKCETFEWNETAHEDAIVRLPNVARGIAVRLHHADGSFRLLRCECVRVTKARAVVRAVRLKCRLLSTYQCFWPVVRRGGRMLRQGRFREFGTRVLKGLSDSRTMRIEVKRATEAGAAWWRRRAATSEENATYQAELCAIAHPMPIAVLIPVDPTRTDYARQAMLSVFRQIYPHWELIVAWPNAKPDEKLTTVAGWDSRVKLVTPPGDGGLSVAVRCALSQVQSESVVVLPPDWELTEAALLRFAQNGEKAATCALPAGLSATCGVLPALLSTAQLRASATAIIATTATGVVQWAATIAKQQATCEIGEPLLYPIDGVGQLTTLAPRAAPRTPLVLAADVRGISGWDHVAFAVMKGLQSSGVTVHRHPVARVFPDMVSPGTAFASFPRTPNDPQLAIAPPSLMKRFGIDRRTAALTMWEADRIPSHLATVLNGAAVVIVPSQWGADTFRDSGVTAPIEIVPLGYDPLLFRPAPHEPTLCTFGTAGALSAGGLRKNIRRVVDNFRRAFPTESDVRLRVKITPNCPPFDIPDDLRIDILRATLPPGDIVKWNQSLTAYVNASYAEGFGFHLLEAMACGRPLISTKYSGLMTFFDERVGLVIPHTLIAASNEIYAGQWADPDDDAMIAAMRRIYVNRDEARSLGAAAAARARRFTWRDTGRQLRRVLTQYDLLPQG